NPNYSTTNQWPEYTKEFKDYAIIDSRGLTVGQGLRHKQCAFIASLTSSLPLTETQEGNGTSISLDLDALTDDSGTLRHSFQVIGQ
ncbi:unnamed protein product, partial [Candidula unifasciata]